MENISTNFKGPKVLSKSLRSHINPRPTGVQSGTRPLGGHISLYLSPKLSGRFKRVIHQSEDLDKMVQKHTLVFRIEVHSKVKDGSKIICDFCDLGSY